MSTGMLPTVGGRPAPPGVSANKSQLRLPVIPADSADHQEIFFFLNSVFEGPSRSEFRASLEDPFYEPTDRLLIRDRNRIVAHVQVLHRVVRLGPLRLPVAQVDWLGTTPKLQGQGLGTQLLKAANDHMVKTGALIGWARTCRPHFFRRHGWALCGRHSQSRADARRVLGELIGKGLRVPVRRTKIHIRPWLQWELRSLVRLYGDNLDGAFGPPERNEAYWNWLMRRHAFDQLFVAVEGPELMDLDEQKAPIVGYAVTKGEQILELVAAPKRPRIAALLLARACRDAIEADRHGVLLHAPQSDSLHKLFLKAGGYSQHHVVDHGEVFMAYIAQPLKLLRLMKHLLIERAHRAALPNCWALAIEVDRRRYLISCADGDLNVAGRKRAEDSIQLNEADFARMLLGQLDWPRALEEQRILFQTSTAEQLARALFPQVPFWKPPLDDLEFVGEAPY